MSESRKNNFTIDGGHGKEEEHVASYKPVPESDTEFRPPSKASLTKSKEKVSADGAEEKLLSKEEEARIVTRVDMADAKYVVGDHRNGDAKIELDANQRQFQGLTKQELLKYADDPFWVRMRWFMFILFWAAWVCMLAGAIAIIVRAEKCYPPQPKAWFEVGPLADRFSEAAVDYSELEAELPLLERAKVQGVFINPCQETYEVLDDSSCIEKFKQFLEKAKKSSIKLIVDLTANYVPTTHKWFTDSENKTEEYKDFFVWGVSKNFTNNDTRPDVPNNWVSRYDQPAWSWSDARRQYYLHQYYAHQADLNFNNRAVQLKFEEVLKKWVDAGASGVRLHKARQLLVNQTLADETRFPDKHGATHTEYLFWKHKQTSDLEGLGPMLQTWKQVVSGDGDEHVFTLHEDGVLRPEWYILRNTSSLRPPAAAPLALSDPVRLRRDLAALADNWTAVQLTAEDPTANIEIVTLTMLLPLTPVLLPGQLREEDNNTLASEKFAHLATLREDASIKYGKRRIEVITSEDNSTQFIACARWKAGHTGYVAVFNAGPMAAANLSALESLPAELSVYHVSQPVHIATGYTVNMEVSSGNVTVPANSAVVLSYLPKTVVEK